ncbi:lipid-binding SYLF domain-containing protein [Geomesophilobacter sediminis]|uniref:Lipid-binding SYLF domain-containing protein n=1 Tax=Geomesophilobacter sediminis TaxID=2798584 RepID=A0A8J7JJT1_9BACT|nr:lipid-binding SYLF domain-containing protein [Geomesophilobacter sediminis]MBJ6723230.1 lipid-binding SYLF domain-containing protein [Geomesophilobacter sediminis]
MRRSNFLMTVCASLILTLFATSAFAERESAKIDDCIEVVKAVKAIPEKGVPPVLLQNAQGIMIIPGVIKVGFVVGGRYGTGILTVRDEKGTWSNPVFVKIAGGSLGWQIGAQSTDLILVFKTKKSVDGILKGKLTLGADASVAAGPVGRSAEGATDLTLKAEIYSYSRSRGLFAGIALDGAALMIDDDANAAFYGKQGIEPKEIEAGTGVKPTPAVTELLKLLQ